MLHSDRASNLTKMLINDLALRHNNRGGKHLKSSFAHFKCFGLLNSFNVEVIGYLFLKTTAACDVEGKYAADSHNVCWYHQCVINAGTGGLTWIPRRCAWGTVMSNKYVEGLTNPCTVNLQDAGESVGLSLRQNAA